MISFTLYLCHQRVYAKVPATGKDEALVTLVTRPRGHAPSSTRRSGARNAPTGLIAFLDGLRTSGLRDYVGKWMHAYSNRVELMCTR